MHEGNATREAVQRTRLTFMRRVATGLLAAMAALFVAARTLQARHPWLEYVGAFAEAAMIGALADWFAVTALFRHPLGLKIPHTAIIPSNKERIGENLGNFLEENFMSVGVVQAELARFDFAGAASHWLTQPANVKSISSQVNAALPTLLQMVRDREATRFLNDVLSGSLERVKLAPLLSQLLSVLVAGGQHTVLLEKLLRFVAEALDEHRPYIRQQVHEHSPRWVPRLIDEKFYERLMEGVYDTLDDIRSEHGEWRAKFEHATDELIRKLATSEDYEHKLRALLNRSLGHPLFRRYVARVWSDVRARILADAASPDSQLAAHLERALGAFGRALERSPVVRERINTGIRSFAAHVIVSRRAVIVALVRRVIRSWDAETISRKLELHVGRDLQYIRINGTLVGGAVGLLLHALAKVL
ncbi:MAG: DUF445 domain-containing protein [Gammaproteobacteria bacterium]